ncbi:hypothetical protein quinque_011930 [Culex quinquefasciatus]
MRLLAVLAGCNRVANARFSFGGRLIALNQPQLQQQQQQIHRRQQVGEFRCREFATLASKMKKEKQKNQQEKAAAAGENSKPAAATTAATAAPAATGQPDYINHRIKMYDELKAQYLDELSKKPKTPITVTLPDGKEVQATSWESTPYDVAKGISQGLADNTVIARVNNELWDLDRPLEGNCKLQLLKFDDPEAQAVFWHSSAHILGEAMEKVSFFFG